MHESTPCGDYITLTEATKIAPGRPSTNCVWRWCRRGVLSRTRERVRLQHVRIGGKIFTTAAWLEEFGRQLAEADSQYFRLAEAAAKAQAPRRRQTRHAKWTEERRRQIEAAERSLQRAGI